MTARSGILLTLIPMWIAVAAIAWRLEDLHRHREPAPEVFRGAVAATEAWPAELADRVAEYVQAFREGGYEPRRSDFDLPQGWRPPTGWTPPDGWTPPAWWP